MYAIYRYSENSGANRSFSIGKGDFQWKTGREMWMFNLSLANHFSSERLSLLFSFSLRGQCSRPMSARYQKIAGGSEALGEEDIKEKIGGRSGSHLPTKSHIGDYVATEKKLPGYCYMWLWHNMQLKSL